MAWWFRRDPGATTGVASGVELLVGTVLVSAAALAGLFFMHRPWPANLDVLGFRLLPADYGSGWAHDVTRLGSLPA
ncbi:MAG: hypothetical protein J2P59_12650, partial [Acidimicrobiales bacterium]|nr:hypothetical protein [Acidimicrobiales bacterium]